MLNRLPTLTGLALHLANYNLLDQHAAITASQNAEAQKLSLVNYLVKNKILHGRDIAECCKTIFNLSIFEIKNPEEIDCSLLGWDFIQQYRLLPLHKTKDTLVIGLSDPTDQHAINAAAFHTNLRISTMLLIEEQLSSFIESHTHHNQQTLLNKITQDINNAIIHENVIQYDEPLIQFVDNMIQHAHKQMASDIHIEPYETNARIRYRQHGVLYEINEISTLLATRITTRLKVMAKLDISERRLPQDGRFQLTNIDIRINTCPTLHGEKIVLRLLNTGHISLAINDLNFSDEQKTLFLKYISQPQGMVLVTGPTGSGKTVTLYSALRYLNHPEKNISTIEDPIEIRLHGINQVNVNNKIGLNFAAALRTFLRQDPDILMVGEIRDTETAEIALQAAQTGHLVLSTLHSNSSIEAITRLQAIGVPSYNLAGTLTLIIAQRLIRTLCDHCKQPDKYANYFRATGCQSCTQGYNGRTAIYEFLTISDHLIKLILQTEDCNTLLSHAKQEGFISLRDAGLKKLSQGITSLSEIHRVLQCKL